MMHHDCPLRSGAVVRTAVIALLFALVCSTSAFAQTSAKRSVSIGAELQGGGYFAMPNASVLVTAGFPVIGTHLDLVPRAGATYLFFPMTGLSGNWYVPVGLELRFTQQRLGIVLQNLVSIDNTLGEGGVTAGIEGYFPFAQSGPNRFSMAVQAGTAFFWNTSNRSLFLVSLSASLRYEYLLKPGR